MGLLAKNGIITGSAKFEGKEILNLPEKELNSIRAEQMAMIFQDPMTSLNPYMKVSHQLMEVLMLHKGMGKAEAFEESVRMLEAVKIPEARKRITMYPHEFSGGMRQRVMIAMALLCRPKLLIADEPTTALDVTIQAQIMQLLNELKSEFNTAIIMITHDLGVVAGSCDKVLVMYAGRTMEYGSVNEIFYEPSHPYAEGLLKAIPRLDQEGEILPTIPGNPPNLLRLPTGCPYQERCHRVMDRYKKLILDIKNLKVHFSIPSKSIWPWAKPANLKAVDGVNVRLYEGETLGVVGESGCGKSTFARAIIGLVEATEGEVVWLGQDLTKLEDEPLRQKRKEIQMIFQDPLASLNPRMTVGDIIAEPLQTFYSKLTKEEVKDRVKEMMAKVGLLPNVINRYPHEFSGGQCQRIGIARALILKPKMIICDEPVSALDVSIQAQVVNLLKELQKELGLSLVFIAHDLSVVKHISDRVLVMYLGNEVELGESDALFSDPKHPYTKALMSAVPIPDPKLERAKVIDMLEGDLPSPINPPSGCVFRTRCPQATEACAQTRPELKGTDVHAVSCLAVTDI
ncbi:UNVERIFIED_CONTAM: hypothetical protein GTU68_014849 [Idotea baltica]|nr:hypothetical protein [Idotea baltica]